MVVSYQGEPGAYSEQASLEFFGSSCSPKGRTSFDDVFSDVSGGAAEFGVVPVENTLGGSIHRNYDLLMRHDLHVVGEIIVPIRWYLYALPGVTMADITLVMSHWQTLAQCEQTLARLLPKIATKDVYDNAGAVKMVVEQNMMQTAAIAGARAKDIYHVPILRENLEDDRGNYTRFVVLSRETETEPTLRQAEGQRFKSSMVFALNNIPGSLHRAMAAFALRDIDLCKIESRPLAGSPWEYLFYVDVVGHKDDEVMARALAHLQEYTTIFRLFGSFPRAALPQ